MVTLNLAIVSGMFCYIYHYLEFEELLVLSSSAEAANLTRGRDC